MSLRWCHLLLVLSIGLGLQHEPNVVWAKDAASEAAAGGAAAEQYRQKLDEWRSLLKEMRLLQTKFPTAEASEAVEIKARWDELLAQGRALIPQLHDLGLQAYGEAPGQDRELENFLLKVVPDYLAHDRYEEASELAKALIGFGCDVKALQDQAGVAAFVLNDYESAEKFLNAAKDAGALSEKGAQFLALLPQYKEYWAEEQRLREEEQQADDLPRVKITTSKGDLVVELFENQAPDTVGNFISLVERKFYDNLTFHRVLSGFMAQGGCPFGDGTGGPGYNIYCECYKPEYRKHFRGTLSMAHAGKDTGGSQFFLTFVPTDHLNGRHTAFGRVIEGMEVLAKLNRINPEEDTNPEPDRTVTMEVLRKRDHEYKPNKSN